MSSLDQAVATQLSNIETKTGKSLAELTTLVRQSGLSKHGEIRTMLINDLGLGYGDANTLVHYALQSDGQRAAEAAGLGESDVLDGIYTGEKAALRPIHDRLMEAIVAFGAFDIAPKKGYVSLRRKRQFAMIGPGAKTRVDLGMNIKGLAPHPRLIEMPAGGMCNYTVRLTDPGEVNDEVIDWLRQAYENAG